MEGLSACECPVCFLLLNYSTHEPMSMPCGHTLCKVCVEQLGDRASHTASSRGAVARPTFQCPICRQWVNLDAVSLNVTLRDLLAELGKIEEQRTLPLGTALNVVYGEVEVEEVLDKGAFGEVCRGRWRENEVAVKLFCTGRPTPETMEAFKREVFVMNCLRHPNVVLLLGACQTPPKLAIIMEFVAGGSLYQLIHVDKRPLSVTETAQLATDICRGLQYLHSINILHRDMKSKNVLLTGPIPCQAKLCDFGLARMRQESATMTGNIGTVHWTAPEVLNNQRYQFPADVYALGMVVYEMVSGRVPLGHMVPMAVMLAVAVRKERPVIPDSAHHTFQQLIKTCTEWEPGERPSLPAILASLTELLPPTHGRGDGEEGGRGRGRLEHQDSLGVVFLSATDSADLTNQNSALGELARQNQGPPSLQQATPPVPLPLQRAPLMPKRSYEDLFLGPDVEAPPTQQEDGTSDNMTKALWSPHLPADEESERTSYNMAIGLQMPSSHRRQYLGEGNAPWPRHKPPSPPYVTPWDVAQQPSQRPRNQHNVPLDSQQQQLVAQEGVRDIAGVLMTGASEEMGRARETERADVTVARETGRADVTVAREVQAQLELAQVQADRQLAEQLQMKEHSFQLTDSVAPPTSVFPPQPLLDTIKSKQFPQLKHVESETTPTESKNNLLKTLKTKKKTSSKAKMKLAKQSVLPAEWNLPAKVATPHHNYSGETLPSKAQLPHSSDHQTIPGRTHHLEHRTPPDKKTVGAMTGRTHPAPPPAPPPPPPPTSRARFMPSPRQLMLKEVKHRAPTVARQLRPVQTIVKRPFRVGHVVGDYDPQRGQFSTQNLIESFNRHRLRPVAVREPAPAFPVGRVVQSRHHVKRMSSHLRTAATPVTEATPPLPPPPPTPRRRLHPSIRSAVERFSISSLHHVETVVKQSLPDERELEEEKRSKVVQEIEEFDKSLLVAVETAFKDKLPSADILEIVRRQSEDSDLTHTKDLVLQSVLTFDPSGLHHVVTEVKNRLPSAGTIELEKSIQGQAPQP